MTGTKKITYRIGKQTAIEGISVQPDRRSVDMPLSQTYEELSIPEAIRDHPIIIHLAQAYTHPERAREEIAKAINDLMRLIPCD